MDKIIILTIIIIIIFLYYKHQENFGENSIEFVPYGYNKYSLTGARLDVKNLPNCYYDTRICYDNTFGATQRNTQEYKQIKQ